MKGQYENRTRYYLPRRTYTVIRIDGKSFHTYTRGLQRPYDEGLAYAMNRTMIGLCSEIEGVEFGYVQSDEISLLLTDFRNVETQAWFDGNVQKMASISASIATAYFATNHQSGKMAFFDSRVFTIPDWMEVYNYFVWRQEDAIRNGISMIAQSVFSHSSLQGKKCSDMIQMLEEAGHPVTNYPISLRYGRFGYKKNIVTNVQYENKKTGEQCEEKGVIRTIWECDPSMPRFIDDPQWLRSRIPKHG